MSHLLTIGVQTTPAGREINIPSVVNGRKVGVREAMDAFFGKGKVGVINRALGRKNSKNRKNVTKSFKSKRTAKDAAESLSKMFNKARK